MDEERRRCTAETEEGKHGRRGWKRERDEHTSCFPRAARCKRRASRAHLYVQPSLSKGNGISQGVGYNGEEEKRAIATGVVDPWMIAGTTA